MYSISSMFDNKSTRYNILITFPGQKGQCQGRTQEGQRGQGGQGREASRRGGEGRGEGYD